MENVVVTYKDKSFEIEKGTTLKELSLKVKEDYKYDILSCSIDGRLCTLDTLVEKDSKVEFYDVTSLLGNRTYERGLYFLFTKAVIDVLNCDVRIMCMLDKGTYCEILSNNLISEVTVQKIKLKMQDYIREALPISKIIVSKLDAINYYTKINEIDKANSLKYISNSSVSLYKLDNYLDYFYGVMPDNTSVFKSFDLKFIGNNKLILLYPYLYDLNNSLKFDKNTSLIKVIDDNNTLLENLDINSSADFNKTLASHGYKDIIKISESLFDKRLMDITSKIVKNKDIKMVLITGPSASGKTTTAKKISLFLKSFGYNPIWINVEDYYKTMDQREKDERGNIEKEKISAFDTNLFNNILDELLDGKEVIMPKYDYLKNVRTTYNKKVKMDEKSILLIEGIHAFNDKLTEIIPDKKKYKIFVNAITPLNIDNHNLFRSTDCRLIRRIIRDNRVLGIDIKDTLKNWKYIRKVEEEIILPYIKDADEIVNTSLIYELGVLKTYAEPLLFSISNDDENYDETLRLINLFRVILSVECENVPTDSVLREFISGSCFE